MNWRRRKHSKSGENPISLFPFLAVLICTMGVLILLLVILVRQARLKALAQAQASSNPASQKEVSSPIPTEDELKRWEEDLAWQEEQLRTAREKTQAQLTEARLILGHIEDSIRTFRQELQSLQERLQRLNEVTNESGSVSIAELENHLHELHEAAQSLKAQVEAKEHQRRRKSYAIIPYQGKFGTARRPIYLECRGDGILLQPEGIRFTVQDFLGPLGPGNPLDAALRAIREELLARKEFDPQADGEPYPLLIVRPDGIEAYYAARAAMSSWGTEFGYELVEKDWELVYPQPDPRLAEVVQQAVDLARKRQEFLVKAAPGKYGRTPRQYRAAPYVGGAVPTEAPATPPEDPMLAQWLARQQSGNTAVRPESAPGGAAATSRTGNSTSEQASTQSPVERQVEDHVTISDLRVMSPHRPVGDQPQVGGAPSPKESTAVEITTGVTLRPLAEQRGRNWGLPPHAASAIPVTRPIRIDCFPDRVVLIPEQGLDHIRVFYLTPSPAKAVDELVKAIREYVETWGIAGNNMYWRPVLSVRVAPGAEAQFQILQILLKDSGLTVEQTR
ncbi:MAG TPA: hypothetical protein PLD05_10905 [Thermogutta sp.]|nr:hypothetical protein [Thermogutta sp.]HPU07090.1 hypothetical protein [Thermogutta sp.]HQF13889.1 hypothetical protein [Thermogutta sp.]